MRWAGSRRDPQAFADLIDNSTKALYIETIGNPGGDIPDFSALAAIAHENNLPLVVDCAHNPYSAEKLVESLKIWFPGKRWVLIYGASKDKDIDGMLRALLPVSENIIVTRSYHPRAATPYELADKCAGLGQGAEIAVDPQHALEQAFAHINQDTGILATGSIFLVADVRESWGKQVALDIPMGDWVDEPW